MSSPSTAMHSHSIPISPTTVTPPSAGTMVPLEEEAYSVPELNDSDYVVQVLRLSADKPETQSDDALVSRANAVGISATLPPVANRRQAANTTVSYATFAAYGDRSFSTVSTASYSTILTPQSSVFGLPSPIIGSEVDDDRGDAKSLTFSKYENYVSAMEAGGDHPKFLTAPLVIDGSAPSVFSSGSSSKKSFSSVKTGFRTRMKWRKKSTQPMDSTAPTARPKTGNRECPSSDSLGPMPANLRLGGSCFTCRDDVIKAGRLHNLPCGHVHCSACLKSVVVQAIAHEAKMPPRCCSQAIPSPTVKAVLSPEDQVSFLLAVIKCSTPWVDRMYCPDPKCKEFVPHQDVLDPKHPFDLACLKCHGRMCGMCKEIAHPVGQDCPMDWELNAMKKVADPHATWKRCHGCRTLVEEPTGESPKITCPCKSSFCTLCGAIWDPTTGCPNICNFEEETERRRQEEEEEREREAEKEVEEGGGGEEEEEEEEPKASRTRTRADSELRILGEQQVEEMQRFLDYKTRTDNQMQKRHARLRGTIMEKYEAQEDRLKEEHEKASSKLEDRQIAAELELRTSLEQSERSVKLRLKHMEAYCDSLGRSPDTDASNRIVTERDLRELGQQYNLRDDMDRMHQSKINVMRDRQAKQMEELIEKQEMELDALSDRRQDELDKLGEKLAQEQAIVDDVFRIRQSRLQPRWVLAIEILCKELEEEYGDSLERIAPPRWPSSADPEPPLLETASGADEFKLVVA